MANMLQVEKPKEIYGPIELKTEEMGEYLIELYKQRLEIRFAYEKMFWIDFNQTKFLDAKEGMD